jgi:predicted permease
MSEEMRFHLASRVDDLVASGMPRVEATRRARLEFGAIEAVKEECRQARGLRVLDELRQDLRYAVVSLRRSPAFAGAAVLSLALGIGANTAIFSLIDGLLLRSLPVDRPDRLAVLTGPASPNGLWTGPIWEAIRGEHQVAASACAWGRLPSRLFRFDLGRGGESQPVEGVFASGDCFNALGVEAQRGRMLSPADDEGRTGPDGAVAVISDGFWRRQLGGAPDAVGTTLTVNRVPFTVVGVAPAGFFGPETGRTFDIVVPLTLERGLRGGDSFLVHRNAYWLSIVLRLSPGQTIAQAAAALRAAQPGIREAAMPPQNRQQFLQEPLLLESAASGVSPVARQYRRPLLTLFGIVALVLLIACANVANLLLARNASRAHEIAVRAALGAGRWRLVQQMLVESLVLSTAGAAAGLDFAVWCGRALVAQLASDEAAVSLDLLLDWRLLAFTTVIALATTVLVGTLPAVRAAFGARSAALRHDGKRSTTSGGGAIANGLVAAQIALASMLVVAAGLLLRTFAGLESVPAGFDADRVLVADVRLRPDAGDSRSRLALFQRFADAAAGLPGVEAAAASGTTPLRGAPWGGNRVDIVGAPPLRERESTALVNFVSPGWFAAYGIRRLEGRDIDRRDIAGAERVAVVNESFARRFLAGRSAVGGTFTQVPNRSPRTIVGVVADSLYASPRDPRAPTVYIPLGQFDWSDVLLAGVRISVRSSGAAPSSHSRAVAAALHDIDPDLTVTFRTVSADVHTSVATERVIAALSAAFGTLALVLACVGVYGVTAYAVSRRRSELGVRVTLGASPSAILGLVMRRVLAVLVIGLGAGLALSLWASRFIGALLHGLGPRDLPTFVSAAALLVIVGALAGALPAWRASRIDPASVLRES